ncbi:MAG: glycosyltransferase family 2 protein [Thermoleophilia bacterium]|nr:glycosyltransferase family 2 protein [Thermoleophilia bacterium]
MKASPGERAARVSVITTAYQREGTLPRLYASLAAQTMRDFEWVIVDDGSTDGTGDLVRSLQAEADFRIDYSRQENQGKHAAVNRAVELARGEFCSIIDSDDWFEPDALERMVAGWESIPAEQRSGYADVEGLRVDPEGDLVCDSYPRDVFDSNAFELIALHGVYGDKIGMFRRDVLLEFPFPEDMGWHVTPALVWNRIAARYSTRYFNQVWAFTDYREGGLTDRETELRLRFPDSQLEYWTEYASMTKPMRAKSRYRAHANYVRYSLLGGAGPRLQLGGSPSPVWTALAWPPGLLLYLRDRRWLARNRDLVEAWSP